MKEYESTITVVWNGYYPVTAEKEVNEISKEEYIELVKDQFHEDYGIFLEDSDIKVEEEDDESYSL